MQHASSEITNSSTNEDTTIDRSDDDDDDDDDVGDNDDAELGDEADLFELVAAVDNAKNFLEQFKPSTLPTALSEVQVFLQPFCIVPFSIPPDDIRAFLLAMIKSIYFGKGEEKSENNTKTIRMGAEVIRAMTLQQVATVVTRQAQTVVEAAYVCQFVLSGRVWV